MVAATTSSTASNTGFDVNSIVSGLMSLERRPITALNTKVTAQQAKISALGMIKSQMVSFQAAAKSLGNTSGSNFNAFQSTSSNTGIATAADNTAVAGTYAVSVSSLAQAQNLVATGLASSTSAIGTGAATTVSFDMGSISGGTFAAGAYSGATFTSNAAGIKSITIDSTNNTLAGIRDAINAGNLGVTASIVNDGSATPNRLTLTSNATGISNSIKITTAGGDGSINALLANDPAAVQQLSQTVAAQNANFTVNGIAVSKTSNTVTNAIQGVTLTLSQVTTSPATLLVSRDTAAASKAISGLVTAYNSLYGAMKNSSAYKSGSALEGEASLRSLQTQMRTIAGGAATGGVASTLADVGISFQADGTMLLDNTKLNTTINNNFADVANLFNSTSGFATQFATFATGTLAFDGAFAHRTTGLTQSISTINNQISSLETRMVGLEKRYRTQYSSLNVLLSSMGQTSAYLSQQLPRL
ncbi:MAG: hypothetical protein RL358_650 [Pseudomonadota bacterium]|jgi:flagellar hook-associated protein 2